MAARDNFCLRLNGFENNVKTSWQELQKENDLCDITLACENKQILVHRIIISSNCPLFRYILTKIQIKIQLFISMDLIFIICRI